MILQALQALELPRRTGAYLIAATQSSPYSKFDLETPGEPLPVSDVILQFHDLVAQHKWDLRDSQVRTGAAHTITEVAQDLSAQNLSPVALSTRDHTKLQESKINLKALEASKSLESRRNHAPSRISRFRFGVRTGIPPASPQSHAATDPETETEC